MSIGQIVAVPWTLGGAALCDGADPAAAGGRRVGRAVQLARFFWPAWLETGSALQGTMHRDYSVQIFSARPFDQSRESPGTPGVQGAGFPLMPG
jgi:hypothetical protein